MASSTPSTYRIQPGPKVALFAVVIYSVLFIGTIASGGHSYDELFDTAEIAWRGPVLALAIGSAFLIAFTAYARWDFVWRDPARLPMSKLIWLPAVVMVVGFVMRFAGVDWDKFDGSLLAAIAVASIGVGFAEETLFRGIVLRSMRTGGRTEAHAVLVTSLAFGFFHLTNIALGSGPAVLVQVFLATMSGFTLYLFRRGTGTIVAAMAVHGLWDASTFLAGQHENGTHLAGIAAILNFVAIVFIAIAWFASRRHDTHLRWQEAGAAIAPGTPIPAG